MKHTGESEFNAFDQLYVLVVLSCNLQVKHANYLGKTKMCNITVRNVENSTR